ncbi:MAG: hypothetical protein FWE08_00095 [Oscillospiraceae bacterium]|nr:hypothetical protein [Oscillospiraceae bacterium]
MTDAILDGVSRALAAGFPDCTVYGDERVRQGLQTPAFFVGLGECKQKPLPGGRIEQRQSVKVTYFPERQGDYSELWAVGPRVAGLLAELRLPDGSMIRGTARRCDINDGLMHIRAVYTMRMRPVDTRPRMGDVRVRTRR